MKGDKREYLCQKLWDQVEGGIGSGVLLHIK